MHAIAIHEHYCQKNLLLYRKELNISVLQEVQSQ